MEAVLRLKQRQRHQDQKQGDGSSAEDEEPAKALPSPLVLRNIHVSLGHERHELQFQRWRPYSPTVSRRQRGNMSQGVFEAAIAADFGRIRSAIANLRPGTTPSRRRRRNQRPDRNC